MQTAGAGRARTRPHQIFAAVTASRSANGGVRAAPVQSASTLDRRVALACMRVIGVVANHKVGGLERGVRYCCVIV
jgi:hypothetical protein